MVGSRVSSRIAQRLIKQEQNDSFEDNSPVNERTDRTSGAGQSAIQSPPPAVETPKKSYKRHTLITSSPSSVEEDDIFDLNSGEDIIDDEDEDEDEEELIVSTPLRQRRAAKRLNRLRRQKRVDSLGEVDSARNKLDDLLAHISKGDSQEEDDFDDEDEQTDSSPHLKRRRSHKQKKDRKSGKEDGFAKTSSFVLKLFDRSVDLAEFSYSNAREDAPLYPVCRSWIRNNTSLPNLYESPTIEDFNEDLDTSGGPIDEKPSGIYHLPKPLPKPKDDFGNEIDLRIPESVRNYQRPESQADVAINSLVDDSFTSLLAKNVNHWKRVRQEWHNSSMNNELRYKHSCDVLKAMFEKSQSGLNGQTDQFKPQTMDSIISS